MAPREIKNLSLPERLRIEIEKVAKAQKRSVNDVLAEAVGYYIDRYVKDKQWASLKRYGREKARESRIGEADVDRLIAESRNSTSR
jgi:DNA-binding ferritin-like protein (Dps family)